MENTQRLYDLLEKYTANCCTEKEFEELLTYMGQDTLGEDLRTALDELWAVRPFETPATHDWNKVAAELLLHTNKPAPKKRTTINYTHIWQVAAIFIVALTSIGLTWQFIHRANLSPARQVAQFSEQSTPKNNSSYITLPDGSTAIVAVGSFLDFPSVFSGSTREITLHGEAYFDVVADKTKPFIIHTGSVKTVVVGTSFNIKMAPDGNVITVTVTRGIVRVEDDATQLAELLPNEQLIYNVTKKEMTEKVVDAKNTVDWVTVDMVFTDMRFDNIVKVLEQRYHRKIQFNNPELRSKRITATFEGTENLETTLKILCDTHCATYTAEDGTIIIN